MIKIIKHSKVHYTMDVGHLGFYVGVPSATSVALMITQNPWARGVQKIILDKIAEG